METVKLCDGILVTTEKESEVFDSPLELWKALHIEDKEIQVNILRNVFCFGALDLSAAYGQKVVLSVYNGKEADAAC